jgi:hypothetical protein
MKANQFATLLLRLLGIYFLIDIVYEFPTYGVEALSEMQGRYDRVAIETLTGLVAMAVVGILLIVFSVPLGKKLVSSDSSNEEIAAITFKQAQALAFAVAGVLTFAGTLPDLLRSIFDLLRAASSGNASTYPYSVGHLRVESAIGTIAKAGFGIWLFFGAEGFANFWSSVRNFATPKPPQT